jgi:hypothetical protein
MRSACKHTALGILVGLALGCSSNGSDGTPAGAAIEEVTATPTAAFEDRYAEAKALFFRARDGEEGALAEAKEALEALLVERPDDPRVFAYVGSLRLLESREATLPWNKGSLAKEGIALLDRAVKAAPDDLELRHVRGVSTLPLPGFFGVSERAAEDIRFVAERAQDAVAAGTLAPDVGAAALYEDGLLLEKDSDLEGARKRWEAAIELGPESESAAAAREKLSS